MEKKVFKYNKKQLELGLKFKKIINDIFKEYDEYDLCDIEDSIYKYELDGKIYNLKTESRGEWTQDNKHQYKEMVMELIEDDEPTGIYFSQSQSRSGSPFTDWNYTYDKCELVEKYEKVIKVTGYSGVKVKYGSEG